MRSKIQIDFTEQMSPCIVVKYEESEDVRDKLIQKFKEGLNHQSNLASVSFLPEDKGFIIEPIGINSLGEYCNHGLQVAQEYQKRNLSNGHVFDVGDTVKIISSDFSSRFHLNKVGVIEEVKRNGFSCEYLIFIAELNERVTLPLLAFELVAF